MRGCQMRGLLVLAGSFTSPSNGTRQKARMSVRQTDAELMVEQDSFSRLEGVYKCTIRPINMPRVRPVFLVTMGRAVHPFRPRDQQPPKSNPRRLLPRLSN
jgi:hypothetical protein